MKVSCSSKGKTMKKIFIFLGPPGSGKGTQTSRLAEKLSTPHIDTGSLLRKNIQDETPLGLEAKGYIDKGHLVPLHVVSSVIEERLRKQDCKYGFILDGFPRSIEQAQELDNILSRIGLFNLKEDGMAIYFDINENNLIERLVNRRCCPNCGTIYNLKFNPPKIADICDICDSKLSQRKDDNVETATERFRTYEKETAPLYDFYKKTGILRELDADKPIQEIWHNLKELVFEEN